LGFGFRVRVWGSGFGVQGSGLRDEGLGFRASFRVRVWGSWFGVQGSGFRVEGLGFRLQGVGCRVFLGEDGRECLADSGPLKLQLLRDACVSGNLAQPGSLPREI